MLLCNSNGLTTLRLICMLAHKTIAIATVLDNDSIILGPIDFGPSSRHHCHVFLTRRAMTSTRMRRPNCRIGSGGSRSPPATWLRRLFGCVKSPLCGLWNTVGGHRSKTTEPDKPTSMLPFYFIFESLGEDIGRLLLRVAIDQAKSVLLRQELVVEPLN